MGGCCRIRGRGEWDIASNFWGVDLGLVLISSRNMIFWGRGLLVI